MSNLENLFADIPADVPKELVQTLLKSPHIRIERIVSRGHVSPAGSWYDQDENEWVLLVAGAARLQFEDRMVELKASDFINIPAHEKHRVEWTGHDTIWLAVFYA